MIRSACKLSESCFFPKKCIALSHFTFKFNAVGIYHFTPTSIEFSSKTKNGYRKFRNIARNNLETSF